MFSAYQDTLIAIAVNHASFFGRKLSLEQIESLSKDEDGLRLTGKYLVSDYDGASKRLANLKTYLEDNYIAKETK